MWRLLVLSLLTAFAPMSIDRIRPLSGQIGQDLRTSPGAAQGLSGCAGIVLVRSMVRDWFAPEQVARVFSRLALVLGLAPILAPLAGGWLVRHADWRWVFGVLAGFGLAGTAVAALAQHTPPGPWPRPWPAAPGRDGRCLGAWQAGPADPAPPADRAEARGATGSSMRGCHPVSLLHRTHPDRHVQRVFATAADDATQGGDVGEVAADGDAHVVGRGLAVVGGVELDPAMRRAPDLHPGVRGVGAHQLRFAGGRARAQVAADVTRRQTHAAQGGEHDMGVVLADAVAQFQGLRRAGVGLGAFGVVGEIGVDAVHQVQRAFEQRAARGEAGRGVGGGLGEQRREMAAEAELGLRHEGLAGAVEQQVAHVAPGGAGGEVGRGRRLHPHQADGVDAQGVVRGVEGEQAAGVAEHVVAFAGVVGRGPDDAFVQHALLRGFVTRAQVGEVMSQFHRRLVGVGGEVFDAVEHAGCAVPRQEVGAGLRLRLIHGDGRGVQLAWDGDGASAASSPFSSHPGCDRPRRHGRSSGG
ncbi:hypothetical protein THIX_10671 [Thiomonas sp. X19]|nr:hypothetical protein THIX_10671 [Thiomonas sp. X19]